MVSSPLHLESLGTPEKARSGLQTVLQKIISLQFTEFTGFPPDSDHTPASYSDKLE